MVKMEIDEMIHVCGEDEEYKLGICNGDYWSPSADDVAQLYEKMTSSKFLELSWQCPGRNAPTDDKLLQVTTAEPVTKDREEPEVKTEFDNFDDDDKPALRPTAKSTPRGSAKKKTTSLASILTNMERTRYIEELGSEGRTLLQPFQSTTPTTKPITSTPDSISQSIDRVLENLEHPQVIDEPKPVVKEDQPPPGPIQSVLPTPTPTVMVTTIVTTVESTPVSLQSVVGIDSTPTPTTPNISDSNVIPSASAHVTTFIPKQETAETGIDTNAAVLPVESVPTTDDS